VNNILKTIICLVALSIGTNHVIAQDTTEKHTDQEGFFLRFIHNERVAVKFNYHGELVLHPGLSVGIDYTLKTKKWVTVHWDSDIGGYWHRWNNTALFIKTSAGTRFPLGTMFVDLNLGAGYMHSFPAGNIYIRSGESTVEKASNWGYSHFMPTFSVLLGYDGTRKHELPFTIHAGVETYLQSSFNHIFLPHAAAKVGITYKFRKKSVQ